MSVDPSGFTILPLAVPVWLAESRPVEAAWPRAVAEAFQQQTPLTAGLPVPGAPPVVRVGTSSVDVARLRAEIAHLELLIKKLQTELQIERQYNQALELHVRTLTQLE